jgi:hypothetical protein
MERSAALLYVLLMVGTIVAVDLRLFRNRFWPRLLVNIGIVLMFVGAYLVFLRHR